MNKEEIIKGLYVEKNRIINKVDFGVKLYKGWDAQKFYRPDGSIKAIHCGWISTIQDDWLENKLLKEVSE